MAFNTLITAPTLDAIPGHIINFATSVVGWLDKGDGRIAAPDKPDDLEFRVERVSTTGSYGERLELGLMRGVDRLQYAVIPSPYIEQIFLTPTRLYIFGDLEPEPYISAVIEYGDGFFRHLYLGYIQKMGDYGGGEVIAGSRHYVYNNALNYRETAHQYLFGGIQRAWNDNASGGVRLDHLDIGGDVIAPFKAKESRADSSNLAPNSVVGGFGDTVNDQQVGRGQNTYAGVQIFNPINLHLVRGNNHISPIGAPPGVRLVNISNIPVGGTINVGGKNWRCFPQFKKGGTSIPASDGPTTLMYNETSYIVGYAYLEN